MIAEVEGDHGFVSKDDQANPRTGRRVYGVDHEIVDNLPRKLLLILQLRPAKRLRFIDDEDCTLARR